MLQPVTPLLTVSAGASSGSISSVVLSNSNAVSFGLSNNTITAAAGGSLYAVGNTFGTSSGTYNASNISISGVSGLAVAASNSGFVIGEVPVSEWAPPGQIIAAASNSTLGQNSLMFYPFDLPVLLYASRINFFVSVATGLSNANSTGNAGYTLSYCLYSRNTDPTTGTDRISSFASGSAAIVVTQNSITQIVATNLAGTFANTTSVGSIATSISNANASTYVQSSMGGFRVWPLPVNATLTPGRYWLAVANSTSSANAGVVTLNCSVLQDLSGGGGLNLGWRPFGTSSAAANASFFNVSAGWGSYSAVSAAFPGSVPLTSDSIRGASNNVGLTKVIFNFSGLPATTNAL